MKRIVIVGGGISGLTSAYFLAKKGFEVHLVEKNKEVGGLLRSFNYGEAGRFDYGAHNILETGISELDEFYLGLLPRDKWQITKTINRQTRALTGLFYNKVLQENSPFIDLRKHPKRLEYIGDFFKNLEKNPNQFKNISSANAYDYASYLFGKKITEEVLEPVLLKHYGKSAKELNSMVLFLTQFTRIVLFEENVMQELVHTKNIGIRLSYTNQQNLPEQYCATLKSYYPKDYGIYRVIDAIKETLDDLGVIFYMESTLSSIKLENNHVTNVSIGDFNLNVDYLITSTGLASLVNLLGLDISNFSYDKPPQTVMTNLLLNKSLNCGELSFIYGYDIESHIFRLDNYQNYCEGSERSGYIPITIESLIRDDIDDKTLQKLLIKELQEYGVMDADTNVSFIKTERMANGFPLLSQNNVMGLNALREQLKGLKIANHINIGILSERGLFFENEVIKDAYQKIKGLS